MLGYCVVDYKVLVFWAIPTSNTSRFCVLTDFGVVLLRNPKPPTLLNAGALPDDPLNLGVGFLRVFRTRQLRTSRDASDSR